MAQQVVMYGNEFRLICNLDCISFFYDGFTLRANERKSLLMRVSFEFIAICSRHQPQSQILIDHFQFLIPGPSDAYFQCQLISRCHRLLMTLQRHQLNRLRIIDSFRWAPAFQDHRSTRRCRRNVPRWTIKISNQKTSCQTHRLCLIRRSRRTQSVSSRAKWRCQHIKHYLRTSIRVSFTAIRPLSAAISWTISDSRSRMTTVDALWKSTLGCHRASDRSR